MSLVHLQSRRTKKLRESTWKSYNKEGGGWSKGSVESMKERICSTYYIYLKLKKINKQKFEIKTSS